MVFRYLMLLMVLLNLSSLRGANLTPEQLANHPLPDVSVVSCKHYEVSDAYRGVHVDHVVLHGIIGRTIHFELLLPEGWNQRFVMGGGGGLAILVHTAGDFSYRLQSSTDLTGGLWKDLMLVESQETWQTISLPAEEMGAFLRMVPIQAWNE